MKTIKISRLLVTMLLMGFVFMSCKDDDDNTTTVEQPKMEQTIAEKAIGTENLSTLVAALQAADLVDPFTKSGDYTVFAPTNEAFAQFLTDNNFSSLSEVPKEVLANVLLYHVINARVMSSDISAGYATSLLPASENNHVSLYFPEGNETRINGYSNVTTADIEASNGVIHIIDKVLAPPTIVDHALINSSFSSLVAAVSKANLVSALNDGDNLTVFAPMDDAFASLLSDLGLSSLDDLTAEDLAPILLYHVLGTSVPAASVAEGYVPTLSMANENNLSLYIQLMDGNVKLNGQSNVVATDVFGTNGVIHVIDKVILPQTIADFAVSNPAFSQLVAALSQANLVDAFNGSDVYTVFAPVDAAFDALYSQLGISGATDLTAEDLTPILTAHAVNGNVLSSTLTSGSVPTLNSNKSLDIAVAESGVTIDGDINVVATDVQATNGVIHVIDKVIVP